MEEIRFTSLVIGIIMVQVANILYFRELEKEIKKLSRKYNETKDRKAIKKN